MPELIRETVRFNDNLLIQEAEIKEKDKTFSRMRLKRPDAAAVIILNTDTNAVILTRQFRYAVVGKSREDLLEIVAGKIDEGENPSDAAVRETLEETGYSVACESLRWISSGFVSPGYTSELLHVFYAEVKNKNKLASGGGLESEDEKIEIVELPLEQFLELVKKRQIQDTKTQLAGLWLILDRAGML
jgi:nudix-type nucleoside diphosphatase (YffH/AdpP family)